VAEIFDPPAPATVAITVIAMAGGMTASPCDLSSRSSDINTSKKHRCDARSCRPERDDGSETTGARVDLPQELVARILYDDGD